MTYTSINNEIARHEKCIKILELIQRAKKRLDEVIDTHTVWLKSSHDSNIRLIYPSVRPLKDRINLYDKMLVRLESYYNNTIYSQKQAA
jgi:hypothetical protein